MFVANIKNTRKTPLTLTFSSVSFVDFEQVNVSQAAASAKCKKNPEKHPWRSFVLRGFSKLFETIVKFPLKSPAHLVPSALNPSYNPWANIMSICYTK